MEKKMKNLLALDLGGSNGRGILGQFDGDRLQITEVHRFHNYYVNQNGTYFWDTYRLFHEILYSIKKVRKSFGKNRLASLGIDTWGTDYGLIDKNGQLLGNVRCMRNADGKAVKEVQAAVGSHELFQATGVQTIPGNTVFQLYERLKKQDPALLYADKMLMLPDLMGYFLTGVKNEEFTMATTSMCFDPVSKNWNYDLLGKLGLPTHIFADISYPGQSCAPLLPELAGEIGMPNLSYVNVGTHDTASAVAATTLEADELFCSSGTWSVFGLETDKAVISAAVERDNFSNEGTVDGKFRLLKNIMGMWLVQECMREWQDAGKAVPWNEVVRQASQVKPFQSFLDTELPELYNAGNMIDKIQSYCHRTGQVVPETIGELARCVYESIAMRYRITAEQLKAITGREFKALRIVGGGSQNLMLNQFAANVLKMPVYSGPIEAASIGNILMQEVAAGGLKDLTELRSVVKRSFEIKSCEPEDTDIWEQGYQKYCDIIRRGAEV